MFLFFSDIYGPKSPIEFAEGFGQAILPGLTSREILAGGWYDDIKERFLLQGWADEGPTEFVSGAVAEQGWQAETRVFRPLGDFMGAGGPSVPVRLPGPGGPVVLCLMPFNKHQIRERGAKACGWGHTFSGNHNIDHCPVDGARLF